MEFKIRLLPRKGAKMCVSIDIYLLILNNVQFNFNGLLIVTQIPQLLFISTLFACEKKEGSNIGKLYGSAPYISCLNKLKLQVKLHGGTDT